MLASTILSITGIISSSLKILPKESPSLISLPNLPPTNISAPFSFDVAAFKLQALTHPPQLTQSSSSLITFLSTTFNAFCLHALTHNPQPTHFSKLNSGTFLPIIPISFIFTFEQLFAQPAILILNL